VLDALDHALETAGRPPEILNSDQGCQFTSKGWQDRLEDEGIKISMDGKRRWIDNVFIERFWRSLKYEEVYLKAYGDGPDAETEIDRWIKWYTTGRHLPGEVPPSTHYARSICKEAA